MSEVGNGYKFSNNALKFRELRSSRTLFRPLAPSGTVEVVSVPGKRDREGWSVCGCVIADARSRRSTRGTVMWELLDVMSSQLLST